MHRHLLRIAALLCVLALGATAVRSEEAHVAEVKKYVATNVLPWLSDKIVVEAVRAQNAKYADLTEADILRLDKQWRAEVDTSNRPLIESVLHSPLSDFLSKKKARSNGLLTEVFVFDEKGLNVGQSDISTDYWQGDEAKWQKTVPIGPNAVFIDQVEKDKSTRALQVQVSVSITDPDTGKVIGGITLGISVDQLSS